MDELELEAIIAEAETSTNVAWLRRTLVEVAEVLRKRLVRERVQRSETER